jgi:hypothetical protein
MAAEPLNYLRQARADLTQRWLPWAQQVHPADAAFCARSLDVATRAPKFLLPPGGRLLNDGLRGLPRELRLPFDTVVLEYESGGGRGIVEQVYDKRSPLSCPRRIALAWHDHRQRLFVQALFFIATSDGGAWTFAPYFAEVEPSPATDEQEVVLPTYNGEPLLQKLADRSVTTSPVALKFHPTGTMAEASAPDWRGCAYLDLLDEITAVLELLEALSCCNVRHEPLPVRKLNKGAAKRGALPFDAYRVLVVETTGKEDSESSSSANATHRSPREHLRRGHIRIYQTGRRIWINSTLVNAGVGGKISSIRDMRRAA